MKHTSIHKGDFEKAKEEPGLIKVEGWYQTPTVQHCHIENFICYAYMEQGRYVIVSSTQIPHICRRVVGQALGIPWGNVRVIKPYIGGGFGNKQDILYEPLCAYLSQTVGGRLVKLDVSREETFVCNRVRHAIRTHLISYVRPMVRSLQEKRSAFPIRGRMHLMDTALEQRLLDLSRSCIRVRTLREMCTRYLPTNRYPELCAAMEFRRRCLRWKAIRMTLR